MTIEQCARELANLLKSGQLPPPHQVSALINSWLRGVGARQMDLKRHQLAVAFKEMVPDQSNAKLFCGEYCRTIIDVRSTSPPGLRRLPIRSALCGQLR